MGQYQSTMANTRNGGDMGEACLNLETELGRMPGRQNPDEAWYAVQTGHRCEQRVALGLANKGFKTYLPLLREVHQWKDRRKIIEVPAFSGYLFMHYEPTLPQPGKSSGNEWHSSPAWWKP